MIMEDCKIQIKGLKDGKHDFTFPLDEKFFETFDNSLILKAQLLSTVELEKSKDWMNLSFSINGTVDVPCDRCLDPVTLPVSCSDSLPVREIRSESDAFNTDIVAIEPGAEDVDLSQLFYDYVCINIPLVRVHPEGGCNEQMIEKLNQLCGNKKNSGRPEDAVEMIDSVDSPFAALKDLLNNKEK